jgi:hypothetical protein
MESRTSFKSILVLTVAAVGIGYFMMWLQEDAAAQLQSLNEKVAQPIAHEQPEPEITPEMIVAGALEAMVKAYQDSGKPENDAKASFVCFYGLLNVVKSPQLRETATEAKAACESLVKQEDAVAWNTTSVVEQALAAAVAYASIEPESLVKLLSQQWNNPLYPESERAVLMGILARATYLVDRDAVAGRVSCKADFSCRMSEALSLRDQTIAFTPTIDGLPRYRVAFVTTKIQAAVGYQMYTYEVSSKNGTVGAVAVPQ